MTLAASVACGVRKTTGFGSQTKARAILLAAGVRTSMVGTGHGCESLDAGKIHASIAAYEFTARVAGLTTAMASTPVEGNPRLNASMIEPLEAVDGR